MYRRRDGRVSTVRNNIIASLRLASSVNRQVKAQPGLDAPARGRRGRAAVRDRRARSRPDRTRKRKRTTNSLGKLQHGKPSLPSDVVVRDSDTIFIFIFLLTQQELLTLQDYA